jgi:hypothetical protein
MLIYKTCYTVRNADGFVHAEAVGILDARKWHRSLLYGQYNAAPRKYEKLIAV